MSIFTMFQTNSDKEESGIWVEYPANGDGSIPRFLIARQSKNNKKYRKSMEVETRPFERMIQLETITPEQNDEILVNVFVSSVLLNWENVKNEKGEVYQYTKANAKNLMRLLPDLYQDLNEKSKRVKLFSDETVESQEKN